MSDDTIKLGYGTRFGAYTLIKPIDDEAMIWLARGHDGVLYAVKLVPLADADSVLREVVANCPLDHDHVLPVVDAGVTAKVTYIVTAYCADGTLETLLANPAEARAAAGEVMRQVACGLAYAHERGVTHGDVKPGNILIVSRRPPRYAIGDFGQARMRRTQRLPIGRFEGTPAYAAPEQFVGACVPKSDVYALGAIGYEIVTGRRALRFERSARGRLERIGPDLELLAGARFGPLIAEMLNDDPAHRPTADEVKLRIEVRCRVPQSGCRCGRRNRVDNARP